MFSGRILWPVVAGAFLAGAGAMLLVDRLLRLPVTPEQLTAIGTVGLAFATVALAMATFLSNRKTARIIELEELRELARRRSVDARINAGAFQARSYLHAALNDPAYGRNPTVAFALGPLRGNIGGIGTILSELVSDAPLASPEVGASVGEAFVLFHLAHERIEREYRVQNGNVRPASQDEVAKALGELVRCEQTLDAAIDERLRRLPPMP